MLIIDNKVLRAGLCLIVQEPGWEFSVYIFLFIYLSIWIFIVTLFVTATMFW